MLKGGKTMTFAETLNDYIGRFGCSAAALAAASRLSPAVISRYRSGLRVPEADSDAPARLAAGLVSLYYLPGARSAQVKNYVNCFRSTLLQNLAQRPVTDRLHSLTEAEFAACPPSLSLSGLFFDGDLPYTWPEYQAHLRLTAAFAQDHPGYRAELTLPRAFRNIDITVQAGQWAQVSKSKAPAIHFIIRHPKLRSALENFLLPVVE